jgi:hypothetical protein
VTSRADQLLAGPRGRRLCAELLVRPDGESGVPWRWHRLPGPVTDPAEHARVLDEVRASLAVTDLTAVVLPWRLHDALLAAVDSARYWQEPFEVDQVLADDEVAGLLTPIAEAVAAAPTSDWWAEPLAVDDQHAVGWSDDLAPPPPATVGARRALLQWRTDTLLDDQRAARERPADPSARWSGHWWSTPVLSGLAVTTRTRTGLAATGPAPVGLLLVEDEMGWSTARSWPVRSPGRARVLELAGPADWVALVQQFPLLVSYARRHDWWRVSGRDGGWLIPDWAAVAEEFDAVHLTVDGYLSTAGRALTVPGTGACTLLGGWDPDATWWLTDVLPGLGEPTDWHRQDDEPPRWATAR